MVTASLFELNTKMEKIFKNPNINFFIVMNLILIISCYTMLTDDTQTSIRYLLGKPVVIVGAICLIILIGYMNLNIAILCAVLLFIMLFTSSRTLITSTSDLSIPSINTNLITESFTNANEDKSNKSNNVKKQIEKQQNEYRKKYQEGKQNDIENKINNIANLFTKNTKAYKETSENQLKQGLLENKKKILDNIESENASKNSSNTKNHKQKNGNKSSKEKFQTIEPRKFDPTSEDDTNLLITKEILQDMMNRIEYNYESIPYLKKYIRHRIEEIIDTNNLLKDDDE